MPLGAAHIAASGSNVYVVWNDNKSNQPDVYVRSSTDNGATWQPIKNLSNNGGQSSVAQVGL